MTELEIHALLLKVEKNMADTSRLDADLTTLSELVNQLIAVVMGADPQPAIDTSDASVNDIISTITSSGILGGSQVVTPGAATTEEQVT